MFNKASKYFLVTLIALAILYSPVFGQSSVVESVYFKPNSFSIDKKYEHSLIILAKKLSSDTFGFLRVFGFADTKGSADYNDALAEKRVNAVYDYLFAHAKFDTTRVYVTSIGESNDTYDLHFPGAHKQKRCVDIWVQFYRKPKDNPK